MVSLVETHTSYVLFNQTMYNIIWFTSREYGLSGFVYFMTTNVRKTRYDNYIAVRVPASGVFNLTLRSYDFNMLKIYCQPIYAYLLY